MKISRTQGLRESSPVKSAPEVEQWLNRQSNADSARRHSGTSKEYLGPLTLSPPEYKALIQKYLGFKGFVSYQRTREAVQRASSVLHLLDTLMLSGQSALAAELSDYALRRAFTAMLHMDDSSGGFGDHVISLANRYRQTLEQAGTDHVLTATKFLSLRKRDEFGFIQLKDFVNLFSEQEYTQYKKQAGKSWELLVSELATQPSTSDIHGNYSYAPATRWREEIAEHEADVDLLITIKNMI